MWERVRRPPTTHEGNTHQAPIAAAPAQRPAPTNPDLHTISPKCVQVANTRPNTETTLRAHTWVGHAACWRKKASPPSWTGKRRSAERPGLACPPLASNKNNACTRRNPRLRTKRPSITAEAKPYELRSGAAPIAHILTDPLCDDTAHTQTRCLRAERVGAPASGTPPRAQEHRRSADSP